VTGRSLAVCLSVGCALSFGLASEHPPRATFAESCGSPPVSGLAEDHLAYQSCALAYIGSTEVVSSEEFQLFLLEALPVLSGIVVFGVGYGIGRGIGV
jgi:hypothetical protein